MAASSEFQVHFSNPKRDSVNEALHFLATTHDSIYKLRLNADVLVMICEYLPPSVCGFCRKIHKFGKFNCSRCHSEFLFCARTPRLQAYKIKEANKSQLVPNSNGFRCVHECAGRICARCVEARNYGPFKCGRCDLSFVFCCRWHGLCNKCFDLEERFVP
ncbi:hypothetical protein BJ741DRAFT_332049 [Chytriomyces cf. hyalinus JEL632]|nr:hypothetical protein BJ741DRAFT_332049 [Chytriomyces cf. hyalinus JEL632]